MVLITNLKVPTDYSTAIRRGCAAQSRPDGWWTPPQSAIPRRSSTSVANYGNLPAKGLSRRAISRRDATDWRPENNGCRLVPAAFAPAVSLPTVPRPTPKSESLVYDFQPKGLSKMRWSAMRRKFLPSISICHSPSPTGVRVVAFILIGSP